MKAIYRNKTSGDIFAIETDDAGTVIATCGPLFADGFDPTKLDYGKAGGNRGQLRNYIRRDLPVLRKYGVKALIKGTASITKNSMRELNMW